MRQIVSCNRQTLEKKLWSAAPHIRELLCQAPGLEQARDRLFEYLNGQERALFNVFDTRKYSARHIVMRNNAKECVRVIKNIIRTENERLTGFSALRILYDLAQGRQRGDVGNGFIAEFIALFGGVGEKIVTTAFQYSRMSRNARVDPERYSQRLDTYSQRLDQHLAGFTDGCHARRQAHFREMRAMILRELKGDNSSWKDYRWQLRNVIRDKTTLMRYVHLEDDEVEGVDMALLHNIPFQITPYYLCLFNKSGRSSLDRGVRAQVLPSRAYCQAVVENRTKGIDMDFMGERATSPIDTITRRYAQIVILKPFDSCPQICVYCQRNWEITDLPPAPASRDAIKRAIGWIRRNKAIHEVLVTGGDPLTLDTTTIAWILRELSSIGHVERIRIGTRTPVTLPQRFNERLLAVLARYHVPGVREIVIMTHVEYALEITADFVEVITRIRRLGIDVFNQQVFTYYNSRRFETCHLRKRLRLCGVIPYYSFNTKGKQETADFRVPIARIEQERKEEARLLPGVVRTDEPVFNVPRQGKSSLVAWQDHEPIMISPDGSRIYRFFPWESRLVMSDAYLYTDVPIYSYLKRLQHDGEPVGDYASIWYYY